jgi:hypothetical protein
MKDDEKLVAANGPMSGGMLTLNQLTEMMEDFEKAHPPLVQVIPNPADVHPSTYEQIKRACSPVIAKRSVIDTQVLLNPLVGQVLHQRTDVEPGYLHRCTCIEKEKVDVI